MAVEQCIISFREVGVLHDPCIVDEHIAKLAPLERLGEPADIANAVAFLAGPDGAWINGQVLRANGGII